MRTAETRLPSAPTARGVGGRSLKPFDKTKETANGLDVQRPVAGELAKRTAPSRSGNVRLRLPRTAFLPPLCSDSTGPFWLGTNGAKRGIPTHLKREGHFPEVKSRAAWGLRRTQYGVKKEPFGILQSVGVFGRNGLDWLLNASGLPRFCHIGVRA
jgi:hypothetical protein